MRSRTTPGPSADACSEAAFCATSWRARASARRASPDGMSLTSLRNLCALAERQFEGGQVVLLIAMPPRRAGPFTRMMAPAGTVARFQKALFSEQRQHLVLVVSRDTRRSQRSSEYARSMFCASMNQTASPCAVFRGVGSLSLYDSSALGAATHTMSTAAE